MSHHPRVVQMENQADVFIQKRILAVSEQVATDIAFHPHMFQQHPVTADSVNGAAEQNFDVATWPEFFSFNDVPDEQYCLQGNDVSASVVFSRAATTEGLQPYRTYLNCIDIYTASYVHEATVKMTTELREQFQLSRSSELFDAFECDCDDDIILRFTPNTPRTFRRRVVKCWIAYRFNIAESRRLRDTIQSAACRTNTLYLLSMELRFKQHYDDDDVHSDVRRSSLDNVVPRGESLDIRTAWHHIDYSSVEAFGSTIVVALRRFAYVTSREATESPQPSVTTMGEFLTHLLQPIITRAIERFSIHHGGLDVFASVLMIIMETLGDDEYVGNEFFWECHSHVGHKALDLARCAFDKTPGDLHVRYRYFIMRRVMFDDHFRVNAAFRTQAVLTFINLVYMLSSGNPGYPHPPLVRDDAWYDLFDDDDDDDNHDAHHDVHNTSRVMFLPHHAIACLILIGASPSTIGCFLDRWQTVSNEEDADEDQDEDEEGGDEMASSNQLGRNVPTNLAFYSIDKYYNVASESDFGAEMARLTSVGLTASDKIHENKNFHTNAAGCNMTCESGITDSVSFERRRENGHEERCEPLTLPTRSGSRTTEEEEEEENIDEEGRREETHVLLLVR